ncbi:thioredoxin domain-containing protein [Sulfurimonas sp. SAG-AH-194-I05]|nr:DsbA family protein [Sulfurimonas sp. SAG-AH-194-I05]MDF1874707.1 thioredoxin domain-containing protein [Sulfurimonas sp. SAG-AH-194-I05]
MIVKVLTASALLITLATANENKKIESFLEDKFSENPSITSLKVKVNEMLTLKDIKRWKAAIVTVDATLKTKGKDKKIKQKMIWFTDGQLITKELTNLSNGESLRDLVSPKFKDSYYSKENLIYGNANAKHKVVIFSDPLCPFCGTFVPEAIKYMKKSPHKFAIYYYHFPLPNLHPAAVELSQAAIAAEMQGVKDVVLKMYDISINSKQRDVKKILKAFNKTMKTNIKPSDIRSAKVMAHFKNDLKTADDVMVQGTPTMFFNGIVDKTKRKYKEAK